MQIVYTETKLGVEYPGLYSKSDTANSQTIIIHIHGMAGSPILNKFYNDFHLGFSKNGYSFLCGEHSGTGVITQHLRQDSDIVNDGVANEDFDNSISDIDAWITWAQSKGYTKIILSGHSLGCSKILNYYINSLNKSISGLIMISPPDMMGFKLFGEDKVFADRNLQKAEDLFRNGLGKTYLDDELENTLLSANSYLSLMDNPKCNFFHYHDTVSAYPELAQVDIPLFVCCGTNDLAITTTSTPEYSMSVFNNNCKSKVDTKIYQDADHSFNCGTGQLFEDIYTFVKGA